MCMSVIDSENLVVRGGPPLEIINLYSVKGGPPLEMINSH